MKRISIIFGTRPEAIKLAPLVLALQAENRFDVHICVSSQHREMLDQVLEVFGIDPDEDLDLMQPNQSLASLTSRAISAIDDYLLTSRPDLVIIQGDTTTVMSTALACFYRRIPVAHVEAGLRTWDRFSPFPEEINRVFASHLAEFHFAPTDWARRNLIQEGVPDEKILVTGNTVIDALFLALERVKAQPPAVPGLADEIMEQTDSHLVLVTGHRRENFGKGFEHICSALAKLADRFSNVIFVYPVHLNPNVQEPVYRLLGNKSNIHLIEPVPYLPFVALMNRASIIVTDSGGIQEEAPSLGKPVLVLRDTTERPEAVDAGTVKLVGTDSSMIVSEVSTLLTDKKSYAAMARATNPYGDGKACERIVTFLKVRSAHDA